MKSHWSLSNLLLLCQNPADATIEIKRLALSDFPPCLSLGRLLCLLAITSSFLSVILWKHEKLTGQFVSLSVSVPIWPSAGLIMIKLIYATFATRNTSVWKHWRFMFRFDKIFTIKGEMVDWVMPETDKSVAQAVETSWSLLITHPQQWIIYHCYLKLAISF